MIKILISCIALIFILASCGEPNKALSEKIIPVDPSLIIQENLLQAIEKVEYKLSNGTVAPCYKIVVKSEPSEHHILFLGQTIFHPSLLSLQYASDTKVPSGVR